MCSIIHYGNINTEPNVAMEMGSIVPRAGFEPTPLAYRGQCANNYTT